jgi:hypothetical protein
MVPGNVSTASCASACDASLAGSPSLALASSNSQSAKTTGVGGEQRGFDGGKKVRGRKRHLLVDTEGLVVEARVHSTSPQCEGS